MHPDPSYYIMNSKHFGEQIGADLNLIYDKELDSLVDDARVPFPGPWFRWVPIADILEISLELIDMAKERLTPRIT